MTLEEFEKAKDTGGVSTVQPEEKIEKPLQTFDFEEFIIILEALRRPKKHLTTAPTFTPRNLVDAIQFYDDEHPTTPTRRIYFYINNNWRYATLT